jgi:hypothetical protein
MTVDMPTRAARTMIGGVTTTSKTAPVPPRTLPTTTATTPSTRATT